MILAPSQDADQLREYEEMRAYQKLQEWLAQKDTARITERHLRMPQAPSEFVQYRFNYDVPHPQRPYEKSVSLHLRPWQSFIYDSEYTQRRLRKLGAGQEDVVRFSRQTMIIAGRQTEKCMPLNVKVLMSTGEEKELGDIQEGDRVMSVMEHENGAGVLVRGSRVSWTSDVVFRECVRIDVDQDSVEAGVDHPFWCQPKGEREAKWVAAGDIRNHDLILMADPHRPEIFRWMPVLHMTPLGQKPCRDISVDETETFIAQGFVTHNSTGLGNKLLSFCSMLSNVTALYVTSAGPNMDEFADERIDNTIRISPLLKAYIGDFVSYNRYLKRMSRNNSRIVLRSAYHDAGRVRGIPADILAIDEIQDFLLSNIPVISATLNNSELEYGPITLFSGTPLTLDNPIERYWQNSSTKNLWAMKCAACNHVNFPPQNMKQVDQMVGRKGLLCYRCGRGINPLHGQWVRTGDIEAPFEGYHLSRAMMPYTAMSNAARFHEKWKKFFDDVQNPNHSDASKMNEIFGISYDSGTKPIKRSELRRICHPGIRELSDRAPADVIHNPAHPIFMGIDWGEGETAYTVVTMGFQNYIPGAGYTLQVFYMRRFVGAEADNNYLAEEIARLMEENNVALCFADAGYGWGTIDRVRERIRDGMRRVIPVRYVNQSAIISIDNAAGQLKVNKTRWMSKVFGFMKRGKLTLPCWEIMDGRLRADGGFAQDILTIYAEHTKQGSEMKFNHTDPDDTFHSLLYLLTAKMMYYRELEEFLNA